jgi:hypothetical protein
VTVAGTVRLLLLLERDTIIELEGAALRDTEHDVVAGPVKL